MLYQDLQHVLNLIVTPIKTLGATMLVTYKGRIRVHTPGQLWYPGCFVCTALGYMTPVETMDGYVAVVNPLCNEIKALTLLGIIHPSRVVMAMNRRIWELSLEHEDDAVLVRHFVLREFNLPMNEKELQG